MTHFLCIDMGKKLLVADDSLTIQKVIKLALSGEGYEIQTVADGNEVLQQMALFQPHAVLIDVALPGKTAFEVKSIANQDPNLRKIPFVLMAGAYEKVDEAKASLLRFEGRLTKPFDPSSLKEALFEVLPKGESKNNFSLLEEDEPTQPRIQLPPRPSQTTQAPQPPPAPPPSALFSKMDFKDELWNREASPLSLAPDANESRRDIEPDDSDIKQLTESTVRMSGLDDLAGWNISEPSKGLPELPPLPELFSNRDSFTQTQNNYEPLELSPTEAQMSSISQLDDFQLSDISNLSGLSETQASAQPEPQVSQEKVEKMVAEQVRTQLELLVQQQVKEQLEKMAQGQIPEIAERVIKQEIRKLLENLGGIN